MTPKDYSLAHVLAVSVAGLAMSIALFALPRAALGVAILIGLALFVLCVLILGYGLAAVLAHVLWD